MAVLVVGVAMAVVPASKTGTERLSSGAGDGYDPKGFNINTAPPAGYPVQPLPPYVGAAHPSRRVAALGDSLLFFVALLDPDVLRPRPGWAVSAQTAAGSRWKDWAADIDQVARMRPDVALFELGTNSAKDQQGWGPDDSAMFHRYLDRTDDISCRLLVIPYVSPAAPPYAQRGMARAARDYRSEAVRRKGVRVVAWDTVARGHPEYFADGTHHTEVGRHAFGQLISRALDRACAGPPGRDLI